MKCAIMQPTYLPWAGYFYLISQVDYFVFLDDAQFQKGTWHNRNRVLINGIPSWITVPVIREYLGQKINLSVIDDSKSWRKQHVNTIKQNYSQHPYFDCLNPILEIIEDNSLKILSDLNVKIIYYVCKILELESNFKVSSEMSIGGHRSNRIKSICDYLNCEEYLSPAGAKDYLEEDKFEDFSSIKLILSNFCSNPYLQRKTNEFHEYLSIIDVLANLGPHKTREYIMSIKDREVSNAC
ncbi:MAG: WbqC family protein [Candidatus Berkiella sp.]